MQWSTATPPASKNLCNASDRGRQSISALRTENAFSAQRNTRKRFSIVASMSQDNCVPPNFSCICSRYVSAKPRLRSDFLTLRKHSQACKRVVRLRSDSIAHGGRTGSVRVVRRRRDTQSSIKATRSFRPCIDVIANFLANTAVASSTVRPRQTKSHRNVAASSNTEYSPSHRSNKMTRPCT